MDNNPLVSIIVPNYNHACYLDRRLDTVFNQSYKNFEVIILDDCSTDNSLEIINKYKNNIHLSQVIVNESNTGSTFYQWEKGIQLSKGDLIWIAESDDYNELTFLEEMVKGIVLDDRIVVAFSSYVFFNDFGGVNRHKDRFNLSFDGIRFIRGWMNMQCAIKNASGAVFKKEAYRLISKEFVSYRGAGDYQFWTEIASKGRVMYIRKNLTFCRVGSNSVTANNKKTGNGLVEDMRVCNFILQNYNLSWFQKQAMNAMFSFKYRQHTSIPEDVLIKMNELWQFDKRKEGIDLLYLRFIGFLRRYFGILI